MSYSMECCFSVMYVELCSVCNFSLIYVVGVFVDYGSAYVFHHVSVDSCVVMVVGMCVDVCGVVCVVAACLTCPIGGAG